MHDDPSVTRSPLKNAPVAAGAFLLALALSCGAHATGPSFDLHAEGGVRYETSEFPVVKIDDAPAIVVPGPREKHVDWFRVIEVSAIASQPLSERFALIANGNIDSRSGATSVEFDTQIAHADAGVQFNAARLTVMGRGLAEYWKVGGQPYRHVHGAAFDAVAALSSKVSALVSAEASRFSHSGDNTFLDADRRALTGNLRFAEVTPWRGAVTLQATAARERSLEHDPSVDNRSLLYRIGWEGEPAERWKLQAAFIGQRTRFDGVDPVLDVVRNDRFASFDVSLARRVGAHVSVALDAAYSRYRSTSEALFNNWRSTGASLQVEF